MKTKFLVVILYSSSGVSFHTKLKDKKMHAHNLRRCLRCSFAKTLVYLHITQHKKWEVFLETKRSHNSFRVWVPSRGALVTLFCFSVLELAEQCWAWR